MTVRDRAIIDELQSVVSGAGEKHGGYHLLPARLNKMLEADGLEARGAFYERERLAYIRSKIDVTGKSVLDIGCNTGYVLFDLLDSGARRVTGYEGKATCGAFLEKAIELLGERKRFEFHNEYFEFTSTDRHYDVVVLLNVLHHLGDDFGDKTLGIERARLTILDQLNGLSRTTSTLIYQMGFNWQGRVEHCLFPHGTKAEVIDFITSGTKDHWVVDAVGVAEGTRGAITYQDVSDRNVARVDALGEFLNRPIFVLRSKF